MSALSVKGRIFLEVLRKTKGGEIEISFPDGRTESFGDGWPRIRVQVKEWKVFDLLFTKGDLGLAETVFEGTLLVDDLVSLVEWACRNDQDLQRALHGTWYGTLMDRLHRLLTMNHRQGSKKNTISHYDLGNEFYRLWLDDSMTYSSGLFTTTDEDLKAAQMAKYDRIIDQLGISEKDHVLEIGCGWGGFFSRAIERTGCHVTAVMNSPSQAQFNAQLIEKRGLRDQVRLIQQDYRDIEGRFDKIVSIEMIEAVGEQYWNSFFAKVSHSLKDGGSAMIQSITIRDDLFLRYRKQTDFIQRYVFPGGMLPSPQIFNEYAKKCGLYVDTPFEFGLSYAQTLKQWRKNFYTKRTELEDMKFDQKFMRFWDLYLSYCEGAFRAGRIDVGHYLLQK